jgi:lipopolysaccharide transport system ATP-binding protein
VNPEFTIEAQGVSKKFGNSLRGSMLYGLRDSMRRLRGKDTGAAALRAGEFWAVQDVSFQLRPGEALGVCGLNGSGKSTLLRVLNGIYTPDSGRVSVRGRVGALIAVGAGFHPLLTGRENIYVNGAVLGMSRAEIEDNLQDIVEFSQIGEFLDAPVRHYSSGMYVRLGFAVAALTRPDLLLVDEVLAVGDLNFQKKCYEYIHRLKREGTAIILVSHSMSAIWAICDRALLLSHGHVKASGSVEHVINAYNDENALAALTAAQSASTSAEPAPPAEDFLPSDHGGPKGGTGDIIVRTARVTEAHTTHGEPRVAFGKALVVHFDVEVRQEIHEVTFRVNFNAQHYKFIANLDSYELGHRFDTIAPGTYRLRLEVPEQNFMPGQYEANIAVVSKQAGVHLFFWTAAAPFMIASPPERALFTEANAVMYLEGTFTLDAG